MKVSTLLEGLEYICCQGSTGQEVTTVVYDSRKVEENSLFICIRGAVVDGHKFVPDVIEKGAKTLIVEEEVEAPSDVTVIKVADTRYAMAFISAAYFGHPAKELKTIGITGTKGKTTTTYMVKSILENAGYKVGLIGTIEAIIGDKHIPAHNTTPESYLVQEYFRKMADAGCDCVVMEVSSQGLMLHRTQGFVFDYGIFTNIEPDHIGPNEHKDFDTKFGKAYCEVIVNMFEDLFGEEKTYEIFQGKTNIMKCTTAVKDLAKAKLEHDKLFQETLKEITGLDIDVFGEKPLNREQRRARKKYNQ